MPMKDGKTLTPEEFQSLEKEEREATEKKILAVHEKAMEVVGACRNWKEKCGKKSGNWMVR